MVDIETPGLEVSRGRLSWDTDTAAAVVVLLALAFLVGARVGLPTP